jgi:hypothetical protein
MSSPLDQCDEFGAEETLTNREEVVLTRTELYEQVWTEPVMVLAGRYGLSDREQAVRQIQHSRASARLLGEEAGWPAGQAPAVAGERLPEWSDSIHQAGAVDEKQTGTGTADLRACPRFYPFRRSTTASTEVKIRRITEPFR